MGFRPGEMALIGFLIAYGGSIGTTIRKQCRAIDESGSGATERAPDYSTKTTPTLTSLLSGLGSKRTT